MTPASTITTAPPSIPQKPHVAYWRRFTAVQLAVLLLAGCSSSAAGSPAPAAQPAAPAAETAPAATLTATWVNPGPAPVFNAPRTESPTPSGASPDLDALYPVAAASTRAFAYGVASGDMTSDSAVLWTRAATAGDLRVEVAEAADFKDAVELPSGKATEDTDLTAKVVVGGLKPGAEYHFRFRAGGEVSPVGSFRTAFAPNERRDVTLGFTGDADWKWKPYPLLSTLAKEKLDLFVFLGDLIYETRNLRGTASAESLDEYRWKYRENREPRTGTTLTDVPMQQLYRAFGHYQVFDNHETGPSQADKGAPPYNDGGVLVNGQPVNRSPGYLARLRAFSEYQPVREDTVNGVSDPKAQGSRRFYRTVQWGANAQLFMLDDRSYRDRRLPSSDAPEAASCDRTMLGAAQTTWLQDELLAAKKRGVVWKVVIASSPMQQLGRASQTGVDVDGGKSWAGGYPCERSKVLKFIDDNAIDNVVFLTTDNHYTVINNLQYNSDPADPKSPMKPARNAFEVLTGPLGADNKVPAFKVDLKNPNLRETDRAILNVWNGDGANTDGEVRGLKQAGVDPIGLDDSFPGLDIASIQARSVQPGTLDPLAFVSWRTFSYATLTFTDAAVQVRVVAMPAVADPVTLLQPEALKAYEAGIPTEILRFKVKAR